MLAVTPIYAGLLALLFVALSLRVIGLRRQANVALGHGQDIRLERRLRVHANFAEYAPLALMLIALAELQGNPAWLLHGLGLALLLGRMLHAFGVSQEPEDYRFRVTGMAMTFSVLITGASINLGFSLLRSLIPFD